jgi:hypothetical protein
MADVDAQRRFAAQRRSIAAVRGSIAVERRNLAADLRVFARRLRPFAGAAPIARDLLDRADALDPPSRARSRELRRVVIGRRIVTVQQRRADFAV